MHVDEVVKYTAFHSSLFIFFVLAAEIEVEFIKLLHTRVRGCCLVIFNVLFLYRFQPL